MGSPTAPESSGPMAQGPNVAFVSHVAVATSVRSQLSEPLVRDAEVVRDLMDDGVCDQRPQALGVRTGFPFEVGSKQRDPVGQHVRVRSTSACLRHAFVESENPSSALWRAFLHHDGDVGQMRLNPVGEAVQSLRNQLVELIPLHGACSLRASSQSPYSPRRRPRGVGGSVKCCHISGPTRKEATDDCECSGRRVAPGDRSVPLLLKFETSRATTPVPRLASGGRPCHAINAIAHRAVARARSAAAIVGWTFRRTPSGRRTGTTARPACGAATSTTTRPATARPTAVR